MEWSEMSLFPKFKIPGHTPATLATSATPRAKSSGSSESRNRATQKSVTPVTVVAPETEGDPILAPEQWYREFHHFHVQVVQETPDLDWAWLRECRPELLRSIRDKEAELDRLGDARLSEIMAVMEAWRKFILKAEFERVEASRVEPEQGDLNLRR